MNKAFFIGIKGVGMTALALAMQQAGWQVSGSDSQDSFITDEILVHQGIQIQTLTQSLPTDLNLIVYSGAYTPPDSNIQTLSLAEALAQFVANRRVIAIAGVGGKTTTSSMLSVLMRSAGRDVGYYIGTSKIIGLEEPGSVGTDPYYIIEADEYAISKIDHRPKFALLKPQILITTNIIHDHPDIYPHESDTLAVFSELVRKLQVGSTWICNPQDNLTAQILKREAKALKDINIIKYTSAHPLYSQLKLSVFGEHNRLDALASVLAAIEAGLTKGEALSAITHYRGAERRQQKMGEVGGVLLYDDYGHHPLEIKATIKAFKQAFPQRRLVLVFESHTYSRTETLLQQFAQALALADFVYVMPIFESAREKGKPHSITPEKLANLISQQGTSAQALTWKSAILQLTKAVKANDLILTMGAGFVYKLHSKLLKSLTV